MSHRVDDAEQEEQGGLTSVGATLVAAREQQERSLESVAADLHLPLEVVRAIESGDEGNLPAPTFLRGYIRSYARLLGLDDAALLARLPVHDDYRPAPLKRVGVRRSSVSLPRGKWLLWSAAAAGLASVMVYGVPALERLWSARSSAPASDHLDLPLVDLEESAEPAQGGRSSASPDTPPLEEIPEVESEVATSSRLESGDAADAQTVTDKERQPDERLVPTPTVAAEQEKNKLSEQADTQPAGAAVIQLRFLEDSWVEMVANGRKLLVGTQPAGSDRTLRAEPPVQVLIGNAPAVELRYRGERVDISSHQRGKVARLTLDD